MPESRPVLCRTCMERLGIPDADEGPCEICEKVRAGLHLADTINPDFEYESFNVGIVMPPGPQEREGELVSAYHLRGARSFKTEMNRELRERLEERLGKRADVVDPDVVFEIHIPKGRVFYHLKSLTLSGSYNKYDRTIPQTKWHCKACRGRGCPRCNNTGKMYPTSVEEIVGEPLLAATKGRETRFHGAGREDIDVRMLGDGRPFVIEILSPKVRTLDYAALEAAINEDERIAIHGLAPCEKSLVEALKMGAFRKTYNAILDKNLTIEEIKRIEEELVGEIDQRTPIRVSHRRSDLIRKRKVYKVIGKNSKTTELEIYCDGGLYIKELISGDEGRTQPSVSQILNMQVQCKQLDVLAIHKDTDN
ncbi:MAG: tRNA pseudouridine(54/55) synthase Pus10 [Candidatus Methanofastidiosa archaeon]|nr:tRNA pseudouridine(54/55) synthase Pus10 [Candidatus Methanofastidiosa archaeon]